MPPIPRPGARRLGSRLAAMSFVALLTVSLSAQVSAPSPYWGKTVVRIRLEFDATVRPEDFAGQITERVGEPLDAAKVSESLRALYATGRFRELRADVEPEANGVALIFAGKAQYFIGIVRVAGSLGGLDPRVLTAAARLGLGRPLTDEALALAVDRLKSSLADNGYYRAKVGYSVAENPDDAEADVTFSIASGSPAILTGIQFDGETVYAPAELSEASRWHAGLDLTSARLDQGLFRIHQFYQKRARYQANVSVEKRDYNPAKNTEKLIVRVEAGPLVRVQLRGAKVPMAQQRELLPMMSEGALDTIAVERGRQNLVDYFQRRGYYSAEVKADRQERTSPLRPGSASLPREVDVTYTIVPGYQGEFSGFAFQGNHAFSDKELAAILTIQPKSFFRDPGTFSRDMLAHDAGTLVSLYKSRGYLDVTVTPKLDTDYQGVSDQLFVTFNIAEGALTTVHQLAVEGVSGEMEKQIRGVLLLKPHAPYSPAGAETDRDAIFAYLSDRGYVRPEIQWGATPADQPHQMDVQFKIVPGVKETVRRVVMMGYDHTRPAIIRRELAVTPDGAFSQTDVIESQRRLYDLGVFNQVQIAPQDPESLAPTGRTVLVSVEEARRWTLGYGGGIDIQRLGGNQPQGQYKSSPRVSFDLSRLNVGGRAQTVSFRGRFSTLDKGASLVYSVPHLASRSDLNLRFSSLFDKSQDVLTFAAERTEASVSLEKRYSPAALLVGRFSIRHVLVDTSTLKISPEEIPLLSRPARVAMFSGSYINDHRDNPADATRGSYSLVEAGISSDVYGSQANFSRFSAQNATYYRLGPHLIFARDTRLAVEDPYGKAGPRTIIPLPERLFMGGSESHRGFSINQAGPRDPQTGFPLGGDALFLNSMELRAPFANGRFGLVGFHDAGNVYSTVDRMKLLKVSQNSPTDLDYTVHAVGLGFRYKTPVGPLRFDAGYDLNPPRYQVAGSSGLEVLRLPRFQIFVGIGQTF
jgi:outer membrane protein insertion porin family